MEEYIESRDSLYLAPEFFQYFKFHSTFDTRLQMASGFVSGGTVDQTVERDDEWLIAQKEIEESRRRKEEEGRQEGGKTLFEVLQQNKGGYQSLVPPTTAFSAIRLTCQMDCA